MKRFLKATGRGGRLGGVGGVAALGVAAVELVIPMLLKSWILLLIILFMLLLLLSSLLLLLKLPVFVPPNMLIKGAFFDTIS